MTQICLCDTIQITVTQSWSVATAQRVAVPRGSGGLVRGDRLHVCNRRTHVSPTRVCEMMGEGWSIHPWVFTWSRLLAGSVQLLSKRSTHCGVVGPRQATSLVQRRSLTRSMWHQGCVVTKGKTPPSSDQTPCSAAVPNAYLQPPRLRIGEPSLYV